MVHLIKQVRLKIPEVVILRFLASIQYHNPGFVRLVIEKAVVALQQ